MKRTWWDTALIKTGSTGRGMRIEETGGSGGSTWPCEGKCRSLHIAMYLTKARSVVYSVKGMRVVKESGGEKRLKVELREFASRHRFTECAGLLLLEVFRVFFVFALDGGVNVWPVLLEPSHCGFFVNMAFKARF